MNYTTTPIPKGWGVIGLVTLITVIVVVFYARRNAPKIERAEEPRNTNNLAAKAPAQEESTKTFLEIRRKWDRTTPGQAEDEFSRQCLELVEKYPDTTGELAALYMTTFRVPKTEPGHTAQEAFVARIAKADLGQLLEAIRFVRWRPCYELSDGPPNPHYYRDYENQRIVLAILDRLKHSPNDPHTAALLTWVCLMSGGSSNKEPTAQFSEAADLIASQYATSPDIVNFCEILGASGNSPWWAQSYQRHLRTILKANQVREVQCAAMIALASVVQSIGESHQAEAGELYKQFLEKFDGKHEYHYQGIEQECRELAKKQIEELRLRGIGKPMPKIVGVDLDGRQMTLSEYRGKVVLVSFWATWCNPCMKLIPHERAIATRLKDKPFAIVGINGDTDEAAIKNAVTKHEIAWRSFHDRRADKSAISDEWKILGWPTLYLIDREGVIRGKWCGDPPPDRLNRAIDQLLDMISAR